MPKSNSESTARETVVVENYEENQNQDSLTISQRFDKIYERFKKLESNIDASNRESQKLIDHLIKDCEVMTEYVAKLNFFSSNESVEDIDPAKLKFLLLPHLLNLLWQMKTECDRKEICRICKIYCEDFIERVLDYSIIQKPPDIFLKSKSWSEDSDEKSLLPGTPGYQTAEQKRAHKIEQHRITRELDNHITIFNKRRNEGEEFDDETIKELYITIIKRAILECGSQLDNILWELVMLNHRKTVGPGNNQRGSSQQYQLGSGIPYRTFILTRTEHEKKVFGIGYPSIPAMTVAQLYEQRIKDGTWSNHQSEASGAPPINEEAETVVNELAEEFDDANLLNRKREMDEYKDDHRRGWGNRMNRS